MDKGKSLKRLIIITALFSAGSGLSDVFVNIYIWRVKSDFMLIAKYLLACYLVVPFTFYLCGYLGTKIDRVKIYMAGMFFFILFYLTVLWLNKNIINHLIEIGVIKGIAMGLYWFGYHILTYDYTGSHNRDKFYGTVSVLGGLSAMLSPLLSGFTTEFLPGFRGYYTVFAVTGVLFTAAIILAKPLKAALITKPYKVEDLIFTKNKKWGRTMLAYFFISGRDSISMFLIAILVVNETGSEFTFGKLAFLTSLLAIASAYLVGRHSKPGVRSSYVLAGGVLHFFSAFLLIYSINIQTLIIYGILTAVADHLVKIPLSAHAMDLISLDANAHERKMEYLVARDFPIAAGRILTLLLFIILIKHLDTAAIKIIVMLLSLLPFAVYFSLYGRTNSKN